MQKDWYYMEYDYTDHRPGKLMEEGDSFQPSPEVEARLRAQLAKALHEHQKEQRYDPDKLALAREATEQLRAYADFAGGKLICAVRDKGLYECTLHLESPAFLSRENFGLLAPAAADMIVLSCAGDDWMNLEYQIPLF